MGQVFSFFCGLGNIRIGRKSAVRLMFLSTVNIMNPIGYPTNVRCWKKYMLNFIQKMHARERERQREYWEREKEYWEREKKNMGRDRSAVL